MKSFLSFIVLVSSVGTAFGWASQTISRNALLSSSISQTNNNVQLLQAMKSPFEEMRSAPLQQFEFPQDVNQYDESKSMAAVALGSILVGAVALTPFPAEAATGGTIPSALAAYGHYLALLLMMACLLVEKLTVAPGLTEKEETPLWNADIVYGLSSVGLVVSGYYRIMFEKTWEFYSHEPIFWLKMSLLGVLGGVSFFPTIIIIQRSVAARNGNHVPMTDKLAKRIDQLINAEIVALLTIPLSATMMSRGVGYLNDFPTQIVGPVLTALVWVGCGYKYVNEALSYTDDTPPTGTFAITEE